MKNTILLLFMATLLAAITFAQGATGETPAQQTPAAAQSPAAPDPAEAPVQFAANTLIPAALSKSLDAKKIKVGDQIEAKTTADMLSNGKIVLPRDTKVLGHVTSAKAHSKESPDSMVGIAFDRVVMKDGHEMPLPAVVQAIGPSLQSVSASDGSPVSPLPGGLGSTSGSTGGAQRSGGMPASQPAQPSYPSNPDNPSSASSHRSAGALSPSSQGVVGIKDLSLSASSQDSVVSSDKKNVHLDSGTQLILRTQ